MFIPSVFIDPGVGWHLKSCIHIRYLTMVQLALVYTFNPVLYMHETLNHKLTRQPGCVNHVVLKLAELSVLPKCSHTLKSV